MNTPTQQNNGAAAPAQPAPAALDLNGRAAQLARHLQEGSPASSEPAVEAQTADVPPPSPAAAPPADSDEARAKARRDRLAALSAEDRERVDHKAKLVANDKLAADLAAAQKRAEEAEARAAARIDRSDLKDPIKAFAIMQEEGVAPDRIAEVLRESIANPEKYQDARAREEARKVLDPEVKALRDKLAALEARDAERERAWHTHQQQLAEQQAAAQFYKFTEDNAAVAPYSASFLSKHGPGEFYKLAAQAAQSVPTGSGWQAVLDTIEENLSSLAPVFTAQAASSKAKAPPSRAAAQANTVSNRDATARETIVDGEDDTSNLTLEERAARLVKRLAGSS